jgi:glyoxylase-like metal-dependent hydrolase (beta-lactamase superfamily II)
VTRISRFGFVNAYLISEDDGLTLIDTMLPRSAKPVEESARRLGSIVRIVLTHAHGDHVGSLDALAAALQTPKSSSPRARRTTAPQGPVARPR